MKRIMSKYELPNTVIKYVLESLVPYTEANMKLSFSPNTFFNDLERIDWLQKINKQRTVKYKPYRKTSIRQAFYKAKQRGLIAYENDSVRLTEKGKTAIRPYKPKYLGARSYVIVSFDIPETQRYKRDTLRRLLRELKFEPVQQSVWRSKYDHVKLLQHESKRLKIEKYVNIYESIRIDI